MKPSILGLALALAFGALTAQKERDWIDPDTGHRVVRLTDDAGGSTLYFHDNAFSPEGDKLIFNTPNGIASVDIAKIGARGNASRSWRADGAGTSRGGAARFISPAAANGLGASISAVNVDTRAVRAARARARTGQCRREPLGRQECQRDRRRRKIPAAAGPRRGAPAAADVSGQEDGRSHARSAILGDQGRRARGRARSIQELQSFMFTDLKTGDRTKPDFSTAT